MFNCPPPFSYQAENVYNAAITPSTVHVSNTALSKFFQRYLFQKVKSVFKWTIPETWARNYFEAVLYGWGWLAVFNTDKFGVIPQACGLRGYDVFYQPTNAVIANPLLRGLVEPRIGLQCEIIKMSPDYRGVLDLVVYYGDLMALCAQALGMNLSNSKLAYLFFSKNKASAESMKKMFDSLQEGNPAVVIDKELRDTSGNLNWDTFTNNLRQNYIANDILLALQTIESEFYSEIGIPNMFMEKKSRVVVDEVNANNAETRANTKLWLETMQDGVSKVNKMFGLKLSVELSDIALQGVAQNAGVGLNTGTVQV